MAADRICDGSGSTTDPIFARVEVVYQQRPCESLVYIIVRNLLTRCCFGKAFTDRVMPNQEHALYLGICASLCSFMQRVSIANMLNAIDAPAPDGKDTRRCLIMM